ITVDGGNIEIGDGFLSAGSLINNDGDVNVGAAGGLFADTLELHDGRVTTTDFNTGSGTGNGTVTTNFLSITGGTIALIVGSTLFLQGSVFATSSDTPQTPLIRGDGVVDLDGFFTSFQVDDNPAAPNTLDLQIDAPIVDSLFDPAFSGLEKFGNGVMVINSDANTFDGGTGS